MTTEEIDDLNRFLAEKVMGWKILPSGWFDRSYGNIHGLGFWHPDRDPSNAMDVLKKCADKSPKVEISSFGTCWIVGSNQVSEPSKAQSIEQAICLFAKQLFSQPTTK